MKFIQTDNQIEIRMAPTGQLIMSAVLVLAGIAVAVAGMHLPNNAHSQTTISPNGTTTTTAAHAGPIMLAIGAAMTLVGVFLGATARNRRTVIVKGSDTTVTIRRAIGGKTESKSFPTSSITGIRLNSTLAGNSNGNSGNGRQSTLTLVLADNTLVAVASKSSGGFSLNGINLAAIISKQPMTDEANRLSQFLGVPLDASDMSSIAGMIHTVRDAWESDGDPQSKLERIEQTFTQGGSPQNLTAAAPQPAPTVPGTQRPEVIPSYGTSPTETASSSEAGSKPPAASQP